MTDLSHVLLSFPKATSFGICIGSSRGKKINLKKLAFQSYVLQEDE